MSGSENTKSPTTAYANKHKHTRAHTQIQTRTYKPSGPPLLLYYSHEESRHSQDKRGTLSCKQASQPHRRSVIISTTTVRVLHKVPFGGTFTVWWNCQFVPVSHSFATQITTWLLASAFQLAEQGDNYELEGNCVNVRSIHDAVSSLITLRITGINLLSPSLPLAFEDTGTRTHSSDGIPRCGFANSLVFQVEETFGFILGRGCELLGANDLFTVCVWNLFWLLGAVTCPLTEHSLSISCNFTDVMSLISDGTATLHQTSEPTALQETCQFAADVVHSFGLEVNSFSHKLQNKSLFAQNLWCTFKIKTSTSVII